MFADTWFKRYPPQEESALFIQLAEANRNASKEVYLPLDEEEIRLVKVHHGSTDDPIKCTVFNVENATSLSYQALSYVWGNELDTRSIESNNT